MSYALANLALVLEDENKLQEAESLQREALVIRRKALGNEHPLVSQSLHDLGLVLTKLGNLSAAEAMLRECLAVTRKSPTNDYFVDTATVLADLAKVLTAEGNCQRNDKTRLPKRDPAAPRGPFGFRELRLLWSFGH